MKCESCGENEAVIHLTQIENNEMTTSHLCETCAAARGLETGEETSGFPLADFLAQMGGEGPGESAKGADDGPCPFCGLTFAGFRESGRLGCPQCYSTFEVQLRGLLRRIHGSTQHVGKVYLPPDPSASDREKRLEGLRRRLQRAVDGEDFERAAELRDEIRAMERGGVAS
jgi:protein arginine kinase activator